jgi:hypothetical protein
VKVGTENPKKVAVAGVLLLLGVFFLIRAFYSMPSESTVSGPPVSQPLTGEKTATQLLPENNLDPRLRVDLLKNAEDVEYKGNGRNIFRAGAEPPKEIPKPVTPAMIQVQEAAKRPPPPPPINLKYFGYSNRQGEENKIFLSEGGDVFVAKQGDIVNRRYKILRITPTSVEVEDVISNARQTLPLTQG